MKYRLGLDMGASSIGWAIFDIEKKEIVKSGVRIFDDGREDKSKASLCVKRREARGARRRQNRKNMQKEHLMNALISFGLFPKDCQEQQNLKLLNPYELRAKALDEKVSLFELGRICFNLVQRKGFLSNRKDDKSEGGKLKEGFQKLKDEMSENNCRTYGEYLYKNFPNVRLKNRFDDQGKFIGGIFPFREIYKQEFNCIFDKQRIFYPSILTDDVVKKLQEILFFQRPLKEAEEGSCTFEENEKCVSKAHPLFQSFRIWQQIVSLTFSGEIDSEYNQLTRERLEKLAYIAEHPGDFISTKKRVLAYSNIKSWLGLDKKGYFNYEKQKSNTELAEGVLINTTEYAISKSHYFKNFWNTFNEDEKGEIVNILSRPQRYIDFSKIKLSIEKQDEMIKNYLKERFNLSEEAANELLYDINFEDGFASLSEKAISKILPFIKTGQVYSDACLSAGYQHSIKEIESRDFLPYYGEILSQSCLGKRTNPKTAEERYGKINNATVHVALNQIRHLVNELISLYGKPFDISIEYARDLPASTAERKKMIQTRDSNEQENQKIIDELNKKIEPRNWSKKDIEKYKIWKNLGWSKGANPLESRECPFTGEKISVASLLNGDLFQIEHLIPFSRCFDDSIHNKVIASAMANKYKGARTPYEAFHESKDGFDWKEIQKRAKKLNMEQQWRFSKDAMAKFEEKEGPIARSLNDTRYMTRLLQQYLLPIVREDGKKTVQAVVGQLTSMVRKAWGLNQYKNKDEAEAYRAFHNHHAMDAIVVSAIDREQIKKVSGDLKKMSDFVIDRFKDELYKFKDPSVSKEEKSELKKKIKDFIRDKKEGIVNQYVSMPEGMVVPTLRTLVENINISHKPKLKKLSDSHSTIGKLHEDTAYGLKSFVDDVFLKANFICNGKIICKEIVEYIPMFHDKDDKKAYYDAYKTWFILDGKAKTLDAKTKEEKQIKKALEDKEKESIQNLRKSSLKAFKWFVGGGNFCAEIYEINPQNKINGVIAKDRGSWKSEIISNYNATVRHNRGEKISYWQYKYPNAKRIMTLKRNDMVVGTFTRGEAYQDDFPKGIQTYVRSIFEKDETLTETKVLFRVKKINSNGVITLTRHNLAKEDADTQSWSSSSVSLQKYKARKVFVSPSGRILNAK